MKRLLPVLPVLLVIGRSAAGCSTPEQELRVCETALQSAQTAGARFFAYAVYQEASDSLRAAKTEIDQHIRRRRNSQERAVSRSDRRI